MFFSVLLWPISYKHSCVILYSVQTNCVIIWHAYIVQRFRVIGAVKIIDFCMTFNLEVYASSSTSLKASKEKKSYLVELEIHFKSSGQKYAFGYF